MPYNIIFTDLYTVNVWLSVAEALGVRIYSISIPNAVKSNIKLLTKEIQQARPQVVLATYDQFNIVTKLLGQDKSKTELVNTEATLYNTLIQHVTNPDRQKQDIAEMDSILEQYPYFKHCLLNKRVP